MVSTATDDDGARRLQAHGGGGDTRSGDDATAYGYGTYYSPADDAYIANGGHTPFACAPDWPYYVEAQVNNNRDTLENRWHLKLPWLAYEAWRDIKAERTGSEVPDSDVPSMFCPDCDVAGGVLRVER